MEKLKFTVVGARGYVGSALVRYLRAHGHEVIAPEKGSLPRGDLGRVIYAAGATRDYLSDPSYTLRAHATDFADLLEREFDHCWYLSSVRLFDFTGLDEVDETTPISILTDNPRSVFDSTKACGESMALHSGAANVSVARLACVYGGDLSTAAFLHDLLAKVRAGDTDSGSDENVMRDYIHIDDVCMALSRDATPPGIFNFSSGRNVRNASIFQVIGEAAGHWFTFRSTPQPSPPRIRNGKFEEQFAIRPRSVLGWISEELLRP